MTKLTNRILLIAAAVMAVGVLVTMLIYRFAVVSG